jgi:hypothetical protein
MNALSAVFISSPNSGKVRAEKLRCLDSGWWGESKNSSLCTANIALFCRSRAGRARHKRGRGKNVLIFILRTFAIPYRIGVQILVLAKAKQAQKLMKRNHMH